MTIASALGRRLVARTVPLERDVDLVAVAGHDGVLFTREGSGLAGRGEALRVAAPMAPEALSAIECIDDVGLPGTGPVAIGALPFDPRAGGTLVVPRTIVGRTPDGRAWETTIGEPAEPRGPVMARAPHDFRLASAKSHDEWCALVVDAVEQIQRGRFTKVVLAREVGVEADVPISPAAVLERLRALYPSCTVFSVDGFVGASPELLVSRFDRVVRSHPLAGTIPRSGDPDTDARLAAGLLASPKERQEHAMVVDAVVDGLAPLCASLDVPDGPSIVPLRNVSHLGTLVQGRLAGPGVPVLDLVQRLHPTPAVGGTPRDAALEWLAAAEGLDRGRYAGPVGWVDARGDGEWVVGIRSADLEGNHARLVAGVGVVADSDPAAELAETQLKLQALLAAVVRP